MKLTKPALIALIPVLMAIPWQHGGKEPVAMLVSGILAALGLFFLWRADPNWKLEVGNWKLPTVSWLGITVWAALSLVWSINRYQSVVWLAVWLLAFFGFVIGRWLVGREERQRQWLNGYLVLATLTAGWGLTIYISQSYNRVTSSFYLANPAAAFLLPAVLLGAWQYVQTGKRWLLAAVPLLAGAWFLADSRSSFILAAASVVVLATVRLQAKVWQRLGMVVVLTIVLVLTAGLARTKLQHHAAATPTPGARFSELATGDSTSGADRWYYLGSTVAIFRHYPLLGAGAGTFGSIHPSYQYRVISASTNAHNFYAQTTSELGLPGALLLVAWTLSLLWAIVQSFRRKQHRALAVVLLVMLIHLGLDVDATYPAIMVTIGVLAGLLTVPANLPASPKSDLSVKPDLGVLLSLVLSLALLVPLASAYLSSRHAALAKSDQDNGDYALAAGEYGNARAILTYDPDVLNAEGINYFTLAGIQKDQASTNLKLAKQVALAGEKQDPFDAQHHFLEARVLLKQGDQKAAEVAYKRTIELDPFNHPEYYTDLANLYFQTGRYQLALEVAEKCLNQYPAAVVSNRSFVPGLTTQLSLLYFFDAASQANLGKSVTAIKQAAAMAIKLDPNNVYAKDLLSHLPSE